LDGGGRGWDMYVTMGLGLVSDGFVAIDVVVVMDDVKLMSLLIVVDVWL
nr:hypothetical protein [Tanacetum cinerariifolium]